jgi:hypothetical protein
MNFNQDLDVSCNDLLLYHGEMTLLPHQGDSRSGMGTVELACGAAARHLRIHFKQTDGKEGSNLPASEDGRYGVGTTLMRFPLSEEFFVFVTSGGDKREVIGESWVISGDSESECDYFELFLLNSLTPDQDMRWTFGDWLASFTRSRCAYDLTRVSLPTRELNLTHRLVITRQDQKAFQWSHAATVIYKLLLFLSFANCSEVSAPVVHGYKESGLAFFKFVAPRRSVPTNRRSWATSLGQADLHAASTCFLKTIENDFWFGILARAIRWQILADTSMHDSSEQALFTIQMLLELLSYVLLVEEAAILSEDGYSKLPASDRITLLRSRSNLGVGLPPAGRSEVEAFCAANSISNVGELISVLRNKLIHPTRKNRDYLDQVPGGVRASAVQIGLETVSIAILKVLDYNGRYFDTMEWKLKFVPWSSENVGRSKTINKRQAPNKNAAPDANRAPRGRRR